MLAVRRANTAAASGGGQPAPVAPLACLDRGGDADVRTGPDDLIVCGCPSIVIAWEPAVVPMEVMAGGPKSYPS
jgi:hypothetical protein